MIDDNLVFKIIVLGQQGTILYIKMRNKGVGKSSILMRYIKDSFSDQYNVTVGVEFASKQVQVNQKITVRLQIWDTAGQQTFRAIVRSFYKGISGVFLCFAIDKQDSLQSLKNWVKEVRQNGHQQVMLFFVGTRLDMENNRKIQPKKVDQFLKQIGAYFYIQTSAKNGTNIELLFDKAAKIMHKKFISNPSFQHLVRPTMASFGDHYRRQSFNIRNSINQQQPQKKKKCCS